MLNEYINLLYYIISHSADSDSGRISKDELNIQVGKYHTNYVHNGGQTTNLVTSITRIRV